LVLNVHLSVTKLMKFRYQNLLSQVTQNPTSMFCFQILIQRYPQKLAEGGHLISLD
jgi:hypothetical protein